MEMHQIRYFLAVAGTLNFTRAAEECHVAQPSLSRAIGKLEDELGGELFRRERGQSHLTELGRSMLPFLRQSYESAVAAKAQAAVYGTAEFAPLRLGLSITIDLKLLLPMLSELANGFSGLELHLMRDTAEATLDSLKTGDVEIALTADNPSEWERFDRWPLFEEEFVLLVASDHSLAGKEQISPADLSGSTVISRPYCESSAAVRKILEASEVVLGTSHQASCDEDVRALAGLGMGIGLLPRGSAGEGVPTPRPISEISRTLFVYGVAGRQRSPAASALLSLLRAADWPNGGADAT